MNTSSAAGKSAARPKRRILRGCVAVAGLGALVWVVLLGLDARRARLPAGLVPAAGTYDVRILRDERGVPHVFGRRDADVAYGLAWAHAEDDFATIQGALLAARGRLASVYGPSAAPNDYMVHLLRIDEVVETGYPDLSADTRTMLEAYAAGVGHYAALHPEEALGELYPVTGADVVRGFVHKLPLFFGIDKTLQALFAEGTEGGESDETTEPTRGSNVIAVAPSRTPDGSTYLVVNSHQPWEGPVAWYEAHLRSEEGWDMVGGVFPGAPVVLHGHNRHLGWAHTVNKPDLVDLYRLETDPDDPGRYRLDGRWRELEERPAPIPVKLFGPLRWTFERRVHWAEHGPAVIREQVPHAGTYAIRFAGFGDVRAVEQWYRMNKARSFEQWRDAMASGSLPMFNTGYGDRDGNIFYVYNGQLPVRTRGPDYQAQGLTGALDGSTSDTLWRHLLPFDDLPQVTNPPSGFLQNANSSPFTATDGEGNAAAAGFAETFGIERHETNRSLRLRSLLAADPEITWDEILAIKYDTRYDSESVIASWRDRLVAAREEHQGTDPTLAEPFDVLAAWNLDTDTRNPHAALPVLAWGELLLEARPSPSDPELLDRLRRAAETLRHHHGGLEVPWGEINRLRRGDVDLPLAGGPDIVHAVYGELGDDGRLTGTAGDSYILLVRWNAEGEVESYSLHNYGSATLDPSSPHYADRAGPFARREPQPVWLDESEIRRHLGREYRPGS